MSTEAEAIIENAIRSAEPVALDATKQWHTIVVPEGGRVEVIDLHEKREDYLDHPRRKTGTYTVRDADSFVEYLSRHATDDTEVWADVERLSVVALIDGHGPSQAGHEEHSVVLRLRPTPAWKAWQSLDRQYLTQAQFGEHIEDRLPDFVKPTSAEFLEIVQTFKGLRKVDFESGHRLQSGETTFEYREQVNASAGKKGELTIPENFEIGIAPFEGSDGYKITARFRYRIDGGQLILGYLLDRADEVMEAAFRDIRQEINDSIEPTVLNGWPDGYRR